MTVLDITEKAIKYIQEKSVAPYNVRIFIAGFGWVLPWMGALKQVIHRTI
ncbi:hypothetical protein LIT32_02045 [Bacillus sp. CMF21]|nr:hypothetical protein LIT32_02045 [Bacillus sp. CMF21]